eukprot:m.270031 g.270031  ORF g.270031 m.270031 type:complete len:238 (+) comp16261_c1_seq1:649-1362(+)
MIQPLVSLYTKDPCLITLAICCKTMPLHHVWLILEYDLRKAIISWYHLGYYLLCNNMHIQARITRGFVERVSEGLQGTFSDGEQAQVLEEIVRMDPTFDIHEFGTHCQRVIIPAVLEAYMAGDSSVMKDWCTESRYTVFKEDIEAREARGEKWTFRILDLDDVNLVAAKLLDDQPLLLYSFTVQQILTVRNATGEIVDGGEDEVKRALYLIYMRRDPTEFDPMLAWEVADLQQHMMQ